MELQGKVVALLEPQTFNGRNGAVTKFGFVIETEGQYAKKVHFQVFGEDKWTQMQVKMDSIVVVSFDISSREWNGKWFTQCDAWKVANANMVQPQQQAIPQSQPVQSQPVQQPQPTTTTANDELPF